MSLLHCNSPDSFSTLIPILIKDINGIVNHTPSTPICGALSHDCAITLLNVPSPLQLTRFLFHTDTDLDQRHQWDCQPHPQHSNMRCAIARLCNYFAECPFSIATHPIPFPH